MPISMAGKLYGLSVPEPAPDGFAIVYFLPVDDNVTIDLQVYNSLGDSGTHSMHLETVMPLYCHFQRAIISESVLLVQSKTPRRVLTFHRCISDTLIVGKLVKRGSYLQHDEGEILAYKQSGSGFAMFANGTGRYVVVAAVDSLPISSNKSVQRTDFGCFMPTPVLDSGNLSCRKAKLLEKQTEKLI